MNWLILSFIFMQSAFSAESFLCLEKDQSVQAGFAYLSDFLLPKDRAYANVKTNCIEISANESRLEFLNNLLAKRFTLTSYKNSSSSTSSTFAEHCEMQVIQTSKNMGTGKSAGVGSNINVNAFENKGETRSVSSLTGISGEPVSFSAYGESVNVTCRVLARGRYEIKVSLSSQTTNSALATTVNVKKGEVLNLGELIKETKNKTKNLDINQGLGGGVTNDKTQSRYDLVVQ